MQQTSDTPDNDPIPMKDVMSPRLKAAYKDMAGALKGPAEKYSLTAEETLALLAYMTGATIALQDQRTVTSEIAMAVVIRNLQSGNQHAFDELIGKSAGSA